MARILLVDDEKVARTLYGDILRGAGHEVTPVGSYLEARQALACAAFDAVVTDLILPGVDGMELLRLARELSPDLEVVVLTAVDKVEPAVRAIKSGAAEYLVKPVPGEVLLHAVQRALATRELLRENASLREYVSLMETGQRLAATLDRARLASMACAALQSLAPGCAVVLLEGDAALGTPRALGCGGLAPEHEGLMTAALGSRLARLQAPQVLEGLPEPWPHALVLPAADDEGLLGHAALLFAATPPARLAESAGYLVRCLALALRNLGRLAEVEDLAYLDDLTHLFNTRYLHLVLEREVKSAQQTRAPFSLLFLDLDHFKTVNDTHGHLVGSRLLVEMGRVLKGCVRDKDVVARYGGDEYVVLLRGTDTAGALKVAERIRRTVESHHFISQEGPGVAMTTCIGVATFPEHARDKDSLLQLADMAMYRGKRGRRNAVYLASYEQVSPTPLQRLPSSA